MRENGAPQATGEFCMREKPSAEWLELFPCPCACAPWLCELCGAWCAADRGEYPVLPPYAEPYASRPMRSDPAYPYALGGYAEPEIGGPRASVLVGGAVEVVPWCEVPYAVCELNVDPPAAPLPP